MTKSRPKLRHIQPRRRYSGGGAGHTWFVRITKFMLPAAALVIVGVVFSKMSNDQPALPIPQLPQQSKTTAGQIDLVMPKYEGLDAKNHPYVISADRAHRVMEPGHGNEQVVAMDKPKGDILMDDGSWISLQAADGVYNNNASTLHLSGGVTLFHDSGYELHMKDVDVEIKTRHAKTESPVQGQGPAGAIDAQNLEISEGGDLIVFGGPLRLTLWNLSAPKEKRG